MIVSPIAFLGGPDGISSRGRGCGGTRKSRACFPAFMSLLVPTSYLLLSLVQPPMLPSFLSTSHIVMIIPRFCSTLCPPQGGCQVARCCLRPRCNKEIYCVMAVRCEGFASPQALALLVLLTFYFFHVCDGHGPR